MIGDVSENLHTFFVPQMRQLGLKELPALHGSLSAIDNEQAKGTLWAQSIGDHCLFTFHDLEVHDRMKLVEFPEEYICITSMTSSSAKLCPVELWNLRERNTLSFHQNGGSVSFTLNPEERHHSHTLCFTLEYFDKIEGLNDKEKESLVKFLSSSQTNTHVREVSQALESLEPSWANRRGGDMFCKARVDEIIARMLDAASNCANGDCGHDTDDVRLAREAQSIIDHRYSESLTLQSIANELYVGKTRLCTVFREQIGSCVAEYLRKRRMEEARALLETTDIAIAEVGYAVGYAHQSSFTDAFRRHFDVTPSQWRDFS